MELNAEQLIKTMQDCIDRPNCRMCEHLDLCAGNGFEYLLGNAISAIKELTKENEDLKAIAEQYQKQFEEAKYDTVREVQTKFAMCFGTYTDKDMTPITEVFKRLNQIAEEMLEGINGTNT